MFVEPKFQFSIGFLLTDSLFVKQRSSNLSNSFDALVQCSAPVGKTIPLCCQINNPIKPFQKLACCNTQCLTGGGEANNLKTF